MINKIFNFSGNSVLRVILPLLGQGIYFISGFFFFRILLNLTFKPDLVSQWMERICGFFKKHVLQNSPRNTEENKRFKLPLIQQLQYPVWCSFSIKFGAASVSSLAQLQYQVWRSFSIQFGAASVSSLVQLQYQVWRSFSIQFGTASVSSLAQLQYPVW